MFSLGSARFYNPDQPVSEKTDGLIIELTANGKTQQSAAKTDGNILEPTINGKSPSAQTFSMPGRTAKGDKIIIELIIHSKNGG